MVKFLFKYTIKCVWFSSVRLKLFYVFNNSFSYFTHTCVQNQQQRSYKVTKPYELFRKYLTFTFGQISQIFHIRLSSVVFFIQSGNELEYIWVNVEKSVKDLILIWLLNNIQAGLECTVTIRYLGFLLELRLFEEK